MSSNAELLRFKEPPPPEKEEAEVLFHSPFEGEPVPVVVGAAAFIPLDKIPNALCDALCAMATFKNPGYALAKKAGLPLPDEYLKAWWIKDNVLALPKGDLRGVLDVFHRRRIPVEFVDQCAGRPLPSIPAPRQPLSAPLARVVLALSEKRYKIFAGGQGEDDDKRVAAHLIAAHGQRTLVVVKRRWQLHAWKKMILETLDLPESDIGLVGDGEKTIDAPITVGIDRSLYQFVPHFKKSVGFLVIDYCDLANIKIFFQLAWNIPAKYLMGIATQTRRRDNLTGLMRLFLGRFTMTAPEVDASGPPVLVVVSPSGCSPEAEGYDGVVGTICADAVRTRRVFMDILGAIGEGSRVLVVGPRIRHLQEIQALLMKNYRAAELVTGNTSAPEAGRVCAGFLKDEVQVVLVTAKSLAGLPSIEADVAVVAAPFSSFDVATHLARRVRPKGTVLEYADDHPLAAASLRSRLAFYRRLRMAVKY